MIILDDGKLYNWFRELNFGDIGLTKLDLVTFGLANGLESQLILMTTNDYNKASKEQKNKIENSQAIILFSDHANQAPASYHHNIVALISRETDKNFIRNIIIKWETNLRDQEVLKSQLMTLSQEVGQVMKGLGREVKRVKKFYQLKMPKRFQDIKGVKIASKYGSGDSMGGEFLDSFFNGNLGVIFMSSTSSFLASSSFIELFSRFKADSKVSMDEICVFLDEVKSEYKKLNNNKVRADIFIAKVDVTDFTVQGYAFGNFSVISHDGTKKLSIANNISDLNETAFFNLKLSAGARFIISSPGFSHNWQNTSPEVLIEKLIDDKKLKSLDVLDEVFFNLRKCYVDKEMPSDATCFLLEVNENVIHKV